WFAKSKSDHPNTGRVSQLRSLMAVRSQPGSHAGVSMAALPLAPEKPASRVEDEPADASVVPDLINDAGDRCVEGVIESDGVDTNGDRASDGAGKGEDDGDGVDDGSTSGPFGEQPAT